MRKLRLRAGKCSAQGHAVSGGKAGMEPRHLPATTPKATHVSYSEGLSELRGPPTPLSLPTSSLSSFLSPFLLFSTLDPSCLGRRGENEGMGSRVTGAMPPGHWFFTHFQGAQGFKIPPEILLGVAGGMEAGVKWQDPPPQSRIPPEFHSIHSWPGLLNRAL